MGQSVVCDESLRRWRKLGENVTMLDLSKAYLQVHVNRELWRYQRIVHKGKMYCLTRLGFGLNVAPKIMTAIVRRVLSLRDDIKNASDSYIDDIIIDQSKVAVVDVIEHLAKFGLKVKEPGSFDSARVLGLQLYNKNGVRKWGRGNEVLICNLEKRLSRRELF